MTTDTMIKGILHNSALAKLAALEYRVVVFEP